MREPETPSSGGVLPPSREEKLLRLLSGEATGIGSSLARAGLWLLTPLYGLVIRAYRGMYDSGVLEEVRLPCPVISIGNLTVGGTGKTGLALTLGKLFQEEGLTPALLNYGYHAGIGRGPAVVGDGQAVLLTPQQAGDEAVLLAQSLPGVPVLIGKRRIESGALAVERFRPGVILLDDAFQYWRLARDVDLVLLNATEPWGYNALLPRGLLREMPSALSRATAVILTHTERVTDEHLAALRHDLGRLAPVLPVFTANYRPSGLRTLNGEDLGWESLAEKRIGALSGLGSPADFEASLLAWGAGEVVPFRFPDHHAYTPEEMEAVRTLASKHKIDQIITTAKDAVKLRELWKEDASPRLSVLNVSLQVEPWHDFKTWMLEQVSSARSEHERTNSPSLARRG